MQEEKPKSQKRLEKEEKVAKLTESFSQTKSLVFWDYSGLTVVQIQNLRQSLGNLGSKVTIAKNTLISLALQRSAISDQRLATLEGPTAILMASDEIDSLKILFNFIRNAGVGAFKFGLLEKTFLTKDQLEYLAILPSREVIFGQIINVLNTPIYNLINVLQSNLRNLVYILGAKPQTTQ